MGKASAQGAQALIQAMRSEAAAHVSRGVTPPLLGFVRRIGTNLTIQPAGREMLLQSDELLVFDDYTPARGDRVLLIPVTGQKWCVIGPFSPA